MNDNHNVYHLVSPNMVGTVLYPLNQLKEQLPDVYQDEVRKYRGREETKQFRIDPLDCVWNDVIHLSPIHPQTLTDAFANLGAERHFEAFEIPVTSLELSHAVLYPYTEEEGQPMTFTSFDPDQLADLRDLPQRAIDYYRHMLSQNKRPLLYHCVPHILYKGTIDVSDLNRIST